MPCAACQDGKTHSGSDIAIHLIEVGFCDLIFANATGFASALRTRLQDYVRDPRVASNARSYFKERVTWWSMALGRAAALCRWPAIMLMEASLGYDLGDAVHRCG